MITAFLILTGAFLYRWRGAAHPYKKYFPRPFNQIVFALPYGLTVLYFWLPIAGWVALLPFFSCIVLTTLGVLTGHGGGSDLGADNNPRDDERLEVLIKPLRGKIPEYWYDALLLAITGLAITLPAGLLTLNPFLALSGVLKAPAYMIARFIDDNTEGGELLTGAALWGVLYAGS